MKTTSQNMAFAAVSSALCVVAMYISAVLPSGRLALICVASFGVVFVRMRCGNSWALCTYAVSTVLAALLLPQKAPAVLFGLFLGYYPLIKMSTERISGRILRWFVRLAVFNSAFALMFFYCRGYCPA